MAEKSRRGMTRPLILGTRGSALALAQARLVQALVERAHPRLAIEIRVIRTSGDKLSRAPLASSGVKGLFTRELEQALLRHKIDAAVHSLKDMPVDIPAGLTLAAITEREDARDVLVGHPDADLGNPTIVHTSSPRRAFQARVLWPDCKTRDIRGNVETRLRKIADGKPRDALLLAVAGLRRLDLLRGDTVDGLLRWEPTLPFRRIGLDAMVPAPGQAAVAVEIREEDGETRERLRCASHAATWAAVWSERSFLRELGGGCATPVGAHAKVDHNGVTLKAVVERDDGSIWRGERQGERRNAEAIGRWLAQRCQGRV